MSVVLDKISGIFPEKFFHHASTQAIGVGAICYLGLKIHRYDPDNILNGYLGKGVVAASAIGALHFSGILKEHQNVMKYWVPLPGLGGWGVSLSLSTFTELVTERIPNFFNDVFEAYGRAN